MKKYVLLAGLFLLQASEIRSQTFSQFAGNISYGFELKYSDTTVTTFSGLTSVANTIAFNANTKTIRESGTISIPAMFEHIVSTSSAFGNLDLTISTAGNPIPFDTGPVAYTDNGNGGITFNGDTSFYLPVKISYSLDAGGQHYDADIDGVINGRIELNSSESGVSLQTLGLDGIEPEDSGIDIFAQINEPNGNENIMTLQLVTVPEPATMVLALAGCACLYLFKRKRK